MTRMLDFAVWLLHALVALLVATSVASADDQQAAFFHQQVEPILVGRCLKCHGEARKGELDLRTRGSALTGGESGAAIQPGRPDDSLLYSHVAGEEMPPKKPLTAEQIAVIRKWIVDGSYYPQEPLDAFAISTDQRAGYDWWSLKPLADVHLPANRKRPSAWQRNPIDAFVYDKLQANGMTVSPPASPRVLIRRATYDLIGLPPTPSEVDKFLADCAQETGTEDSVGEATYATLIDRLLASPRYGEHWGRHWLDVVRFGESNGFERNVLIPNLWPFRDYVIESLNEDKPFDQLVNEHLAGDMIGSGDADVEVGTAFLICGPYDNVGNQDAEQAAQIRANTIDEMIRGSSEAFLGLTVGCSRCHDHKFDPISQRDYYSLYATFAGVYRGQRPVASREVKQEYYKNEKQLEKTKGALLKEKDTIEQGIVARAKTNAADLEARWTRPKTSRRGNSEPFPAVEAQHIRLLVEGKDGNPRANTGFGIEEFEVWTAEIEPRNAAAAANGGVAKGVSRKARDFDDAYNAALTIDGQHGARWVAYGSMLTISFAQPQTINRVSFSTDAEGDAGNDPVATSPCEYRIEVSSDGENWLEVANSHDREPTNNAHRYVRLLRSEINEEEQQRIATIRAQIAEIEAQLSRTPDFPIWWLGNYKQHDGPFHIFIGGSPQRTGAAVLPASLDTLKRALDGYELTPSAHEGDRRLALARWLVDRNNPLTPRVLANRLWHYHFGTGIVNTPSDFGFMGGRPTHPELLDWLAGQLHQHGWQIKPLHKQIMQSQTYQQSSKYRSAAAAVDADSRLLWRFPPRRLASEEIRDTMLSVTGQLNLKMGGPGFRLYRYLEDNVATYVPLDKHGPETFRRSVYHQNARAMLVDLMSDFDSPDCAFSAPRRATTTTPLQALTLLNHTFTMDMSRQLAQRVEADTDPLSRPLQVSRAFELVFSRQPTSEENSLGVRLVQQHGLPAFCRALFNANEFVYLD